MLQKNAAEIYAMKTRIKDRDVLAYIEEMEQQNERLHSHHSDCKAEIGEMATTAQRWRIQAAVAEGLAQYFNSIYLPGSSFMTLDDLKTEIKMQTNRLIEQHKKGVSFWKDPIVSKIFPDMEREPAGV